mmetsp:Transcript_19642/g.49773  ORF Transcript_19642/g.49773 Transcript_19642/m.49773 type:complete len:261 (-) Transcript_19642:401-1183(-)
MPAPTPCPCPCPRWLLVLGAEASFRASWCPLGCEIAGCVHMGGRGRERLVCPAHVGISLYTGRERKARRRREAVSVAWIWTPRAPAPSPRTQEARPPAAHPTTHPNPCTLDRPRDAPEGGSGAALEAHERLEVFHPRPLKLGQQGLGVVAEAQAGHGPHPVAGKGGLPAQPQRRLLQQMGPLAPVALYASGDDVGPRVPTALAARDDVVHAARLRAAVLARAVVPSHNVFEVEGQIECMLLDGRAPSRLVPPPVPRPLLL